MPVSRREEIEAKRQKLQALRKQRQEREQREKEVTYSSVGQSVSTRSSRSSSASYDVVGVQSPSRRGQLGSSQLSSGKQNVDRLVDELLITRSPENYKAPFSPKSEDNSLLLDSSSDVVSPVKANAKQVSLPKYVDASVQTETPDMKQRVKETINYDKAIQTLDFQILREEQLAEKQAEWEQQLRRKIEEELKEKAQTNNVELHDKTVENETDYLDRVDDSDDDEIEFINLRKFAEQLKLSKMESMAQTNQSKLNLFFDQSFKIVNRALNENEFKLLEDYSKAVDNAVASEDELLRTNNVYEDQTCSIKITQTFSLYNDNFCHDRCLNDLDWSIKGDLIVGAYSAKGSSKSTCLNKLNYNTDASSSDASNTDAPGTETGSNILIWNLNYQNNLPEYIFKAPTEILSVAFNKINPALVYGGGYNGKIYCWDTRVPGSAPTFVTSLHHGKSGSHLFPIYTLKHELGTNNNSSSNSNENHGVLVSSSTDGTLCSWSPYSLQAPLSTAVQLLSPTGLLAKYDKLAPLAMANLGNEPGSYSALVGCEDGRIYRIKDWNAFLPLVSSNKNHGLVDVKNVFQGHASSPVTGLSCHPSRNDNLNKLFLSSGYDWNIKLWKLNSFHNSHTIDDYDLDNSSADGLGSGLVELVPPILEINRDDIVMDVKWRPLSLSSSANSQFVSVGGSAKLEYWDLLKDTVSPVLEVDVVNDTLLGTLDKSLEQNKDQIKASGALTKVIFNGNGSRIATGGLDGFLNVFDIEETLIKPEKDSAEDAMVSLFI